MFRNCLEFLAFIERKQIHLLFEEMEDIEITLINSVQLIQIYLIKKPLQT